jgi:branched-chain amino acid aminotransferase
MIPKVSKIWIDGKFVDWDKAQVHILTHSLHYGSGVFEGIRAYETSKGTAIFRLTDHLKRLFRSAEVYRMKIPYSLKELVEATKNLIKINKLKSCYIRPIVFRGYGEMGLSPLASEVKTAIACWPWGAYLGEEGIKSGVKAIISSWQRISPKALPIQAKATGQYLNSILAKLEALDNKAEEAIMLDGRGFISEGPGENIFVVKENKLFTPSLKSGILAGITRDSVIKIAPDLKIKVFEKDVLKEELFACEEAFFTGTAVEVAPIREVDGKKIPQPWPKTRKIQKIFYSIVKDANPKYKNWLEFV